MPNTKKETLQDDWKLILNNITFNLEVTRRKVGKKLEKKGKENIQ